MEEESLNTPTRTSRIVIGDERPGAASEAVEFRIETSVSRSQSGSGGNAKAKSNRSEPLALRMLAKILSGRALLALGLLAVALGFVCTVVLSLTETIRPITEIVGHLASAMRVLHPQDVWKTVAYPIRDGALGITWCRVVGLGCGGDDILDDALRTQPYSALDPIWESSPVSLGTTFIDCLQDLAGLRIQADAVSQ